MQSVWPSNTPEGLAFTPAFALKPETPIIFLGLISPARNGVVQPLISQQTQACLLNLEDTLAAVGSNAKPVKVTRFMRDVREVWTSQQEFDRHFGASNPASTLIEVPTCSHPDVRIELEVWTAATIIGVSQEARTMGDNGIPLAIATDPRANLAFINGVAGDAAGTGAVAELNACLDDIGNRLSAAGGLAGSIVKLSLYLVDMRLWSTIRAALLARYGRWIPVLVPVAVHKVQQEGASIEADATVVVPPATAKDASDVARTGVDRGLLVLSGAAALPLYVGGKAQDAYYYQPEPSAAAQTTISLRNLEIVLRTAGSNWADVFKTTWYISDIREWPQIREAAHAVLGRPPPNPSVIEVSKLVLPAVRVEADIWAMLR
ncbi:hypothetical protein BKA64DRAFT_684890 [Cadophora sp. MPI-SDFR-AT-0126]|nr:hypothetical protein BKA64DRAFT_684890 [Leotiomycetes sp. MPI-SDFR-AT-0126]